LDSNDVLSPPAVAPTPAPDEKKRAVAQVLQDVQEQARALLDGGKVAPYALRYWADQDGSLSGAAHVSLLTVVEAADDTPEGSALRQTAIAFALDGETDPIRSDPRVKGELEKALLKPLTSFAEHITQAIGPGGNEGHTYQAEVPEHEGVFLWEEHLARTIEGIQCAGEACRELAAQLRKLSSDRFARYRAGEALSLDLFVNFLPSRERVGAPRFVVALAKALWRDVVLPGLKRRNPPALAMIVHEPVAALFSRVRREEERNGQRALALHGLTDDLLVRVSAVDADTLNAVFVDRGLELFGTITAHRLLRWQITTGHRQAIEGHADPRVLSIKGGYSTLAHDPAFLGLSGKKAADEVRAIIEAEHACEIPLPPTGDYSRLLIRRFIPAQGQRKAHLELVLGTALLPNYVHELKEAMGQSRERSRALRLVPILDLPPLAGQRRNEHGPQATFSMLLVAYLRDHAQELVAEGGVRIDTQAMTTLARRAGLSPSLVPTVIDRWIQDGDDAPAFLKLVDADRYTLADRFTLERHFIETGGQRELDGSSNGKSSAEKRAATRRQITQRKK
jgi:hypothetical protein